MKFELAFEVLLLLTVLAATGNVTANNVIAEQWASNFNESNTYTFIKDVGYDRGVEVIKVQFKDAFRGSDSNLAHVDRILQISDTNSSQVIINDSHEIMLTSGTPLKLEEGYELAIKSIDIDGENVYLELSKNGKAVDSAMIIPPNEFEDSYTYTKDLDHTGSVELIKVHFKNAFRGADSNLATIDRILQVSDANSSQIIINDSQKRAITSGTPLKLEEGYELAIRSVDINGNKVYVELSKRGKIVDSAVIIPPNAIEDTYTYTKDLDHTGNVELIKVHFKNSFRGSDSNLATTDRILQVSDSNSSQIITNDSIERTITSGTPLKLEEEYKLAIRSIDIDGNKAYVELSKSGEIVDVAVIIPPNAVEDTYTYTKDLDHSGSAEVIKVHFKNAFRGAESNFAIIDRILQVSDTNSSQVIETNSDRSTITSSAPLKLKEGYELAIRSIDIDGNKAYVELSKSGEVVDSVVIILPAPILYNKGLDLYYQDKYVEAISILDKAIEIDPQYARAWVYKGSALDELGKHEEAIKAYDKAIEIDPQYELPWNNKGIALEELEQFDDALIAYNEAIKLDPEDANAWFRKGYALGKLGELNESIKAYDKTIEIEPEYAMAWNNKASNLLDLGINDESLRASEKAIEIDSELAIAWRNKGNALDGLARYDEAIQSYNTANSIDQTYSFSMIGKGNSHYNAGEYVAAIRYYDEAIKQDPKNKYAWYDKADALRMLHRNSEAETAYSKARELGYSGPMTLMEMTTK